jgi:hypothetical protein
MDERTLQALSKALTHLVFRNFLAKYYGQGWDRAERIDILI